MFKNKILAKHAKKFTGDKDSAPILQGVHYASDGSAYANNRHYAIRVKGAHKFEKPVTLHAKTGLPIDGEYPDIGRIFDSAKFKSEVSYHHRSELEQAYFAASCAHAVAAKIDKKTPRIDIITENRSVYLQINHDEGCLKFKGFIGNADVTNLEKRALNAEYLLNALAVFMDTPHQYAPKVKFNGPIDPIMVTNEHDVDVLILPFRTPQ